MCRLVVGQKVKHSSSGECFTIVKLGEKIAVCLIEKTYYLKGYRVLIDKQICLIENLEPIL